MCFYHGTVYIIRTFTYLDIFWLRFNSRDGNLFMVMFSASLNSQPSSVQPSGQESNLPSQPCFCLDWP